jgi:hypothetical protein
MHRFADETLVLRMICAGEVDFVHGLHREGFVYVNVLCVVIVFVIAVDLYLCDGNMLCFQIDVSMV